MLGGAVREFGGQRAAGDLSDPGEEGGRAAELEREVAA